MSANDSAEPRDPHSADEELFAAESGCVKAHYTDAQRLERIHQELTKSFASLAGLGPAVSIFGSAQVQPGDLPYRIAQDIGYKLAQQQLVVITGGGPGCMEAAAFGAHQAGGRTVGLHIDLPEEPSDPALFDLSLRFHYFFCRKLTFVRYASAFIVLPGGFGTLDELFEALTLIKTHKAKHFPVVLIGCDFWRGLLQWLQSELVCAQMLTQEALELLIVTDDLDEAIEHVVRATEHQRILPPNSQFFLQKGK